MAEIMKKIISKAVNTQSETCRKVQQVLQCHDHEFDYLKLGKYSQLKRELFKGYSS